LNEDGFTKQDVEEAIALLKNDPYDITMTDDFADLLIDALEFYKETQYIG
jgi:hypothetical protein